MFFQEVPYTTVQSQYVDVSDNYVQDDSMLVKQGVELILSQNSLIESFSVLISGKKALVGVIPYPLYSRSQRLALEAAIKADISNVYGFDEVLVSFDMDIIYEINKLNKRGDITNKEAESLMYSVKVRRDS
ncbi:MAG: hypothetical protein HFE33_02295 [Clostridia bacterium]|jgi:hypothetical protein|nr:hypothetical protein [Clostridia bacterium]MCI8944492.1 hypothetical protein [Clostridia bacterium]MCI9291454.1 hypothetical protein [Clostridia bacterium]